MHYIKNISSWHWIIEFTMPVGSAKVNFTKKKDGFFPISQTLISTLLLSALLLSFSHSLCFPPGCNGRSSQDSKLVPHCQQKNDFLDFAATSTSQNLLQNIFKICSFTFYRAHFLSFLGLQILELLVREGTSWVWEKSMGSISDLTNTFIFEILFWGICSCSFQNYKRFPREWKNVHTNFLVSEQNQNQLLPVQGGNWKWRIFHIDESIILWL